MYVHIVYWAVQLYMSLLAVNTGIYLACMYARKGNGDKEYSFDDDSKHFPEDKNIWYVDIWLIRVVANMVFAIFVEVNLT